MPIYYAEIFLNANTPLLTWKIETDINIGSLVLVPFRNSLKKGIVLKVSTEKPKFETQSIREIINPNFCSPQIIAWSQTLAKRYFIKQTKILSLFFPNSLFDKNDPVKRQIFYTQNTLIEEKLWRSSGQKALLKLLKTEKKITRAAALEIMSSTSLKNLLDKNFIKTTTGQIETNLPEITFKESLQTLTPAQTDAFNNINKSEIPVLLWGVTGSGKTEIYKHLTAETKGQVLILVPEIGLTPQLITNFQSVFGNEIAVWHSKLSAGEKIQEWARINTGEARILIGARSSCFVPFKNLKLIIIDEEHEWTYKNEFNPRFITHDLANDLAQIHGAKIVLGSATPRLESWHKAEHNEYQLVSLQDKVFQATPPNIELVDLRQEFTRGNYLPVSEKLKISIKEALKRKEQVILFLNKRGFASLTLCTQCGHQWYCPNCDTALKAHGQKKNTKLLCHYCGHLEAFPNQCPNCKACEFRHQGWGTEQLENLLKEYFPMAKIERADRDTMSGKENFNALWGRFNRGESDILVGTQMITKGLDFGKVSLVGIISADAGLTLPDFRTEERMWQLLLQVMGRAGRRKNSGKVIIQTFDPAHRLFSYLAPLSVPDFLQAEKELRKRHKFPPFTHLAKLTINHYQKETSFFTAQDVFKQADRLSKNNDWNKKINEVSWAPAFFPKLQNKYWFHVFIKSTDQDSLHQFIVALNLEKNIKIDLTPNSLL